MQVQQPNSAEPAAAHPFVNVIVHFGATSTGAAAEPSSFRAKLGPHPITTLFADEIEDGRVIGKRAALPQDIVNVKGAKNLLKLRVRSDPKTDPKGRTYRDSDKVKFPAQVVPNTPPVAAANASAGVVTPGVAIVFDATGSHDDDLDPLTYSWDFGDGATAADKIASHVYTATDAARIATLTVSDGQATASEQLTLLPPPPECDGNVLPGVLRVDGTESLDVGAVALGAAGTRTFAVHNDGDPASQIKLRIEVTGPGFSVDPTDVTLDAGASMPITLRFAPSSAGHVAGQVTIVPCADAAQAPVPLLAHGFGGTAPGTGPTLAAAPLFVNDGLLKALLPDGSRATVNLAAGHCQRATGISTHDLCLAERDCGVQAESCQPSRGPIDTFDPVDFCGDGQGYLYVLAPNSVLDNSDTNPITGSLVRFRLGGDGAVTERQILRRVTEDTEQMACDRNAPTSGGNVFLAERHPVPDRDACIRDARESLTAVRKTNGNGNVVGNIDRIDQFENPPLDACDDDISGVEHLEVGADGGSAFFTGEDSGGIYRLRPTPLQILQSTPLLITERFQLHSTGALLYATTTDVGSSSRVNLYEILPEQAETGALRIEDLTPCATYALPSQRAAGSTRRASMVASFASGPAAAPAGDGIVLVNVADPDLDRLRDPLGIRATVAFALPASGAGCSALGVVNLDVFGAMRF